MRGRGAFYLSFTAQILLSYAQDSSPPEIWIIDIDNNPAPSPENGPPLSYYATRDMSLLPYQILGIVGGYVLFVLILGSLLLTFARRLRQQARRGFDRGVKDTEMTKPPAHVKDHSFMTYKSRDAWGAGKKSSAGSTVTVTPVAGHGATFDEGIIARDKHKLQAGLADIYGAVFAAEESGPRAEQRPSDLRLTTNFGSPYQTPSQFPNSAASRSSNTPSHQPRGSITNFSKPMMSPTMSESPYAPFQAHQRVSSDSRAMPRQTSRASRSASLSQVGHHARRQEEDDEDAFPPQYYFEPHSPEIPPSRTPEIHGVPPAVPANALDWSDSYHMPAERPRAWPQANPQRPVTAPQHDMMRVVAEEEPGYSPITPSTPAGRAAPSAGNVHNVLPLRQKSSQNLRNNRLDTRLPNARSREGLLSPVLPSPGMLSPGPILNRTLDMPDDSFMRSFPTGMRTPLTGSLMSTQSQFKQYNHAETRAERKQREREERTVHGIVEEDLVPDDQDVWASTY
ncbi:uncharacterized protein K489DRAFT_381107 [Dissoconium aciculare CBS 342.82]|uniref:Uncharacterized protein n=1 Tax=Dissoconium aciculare CBS 342.82 TaxID=1314786 RepID=A0A6J3M4F5_9PEZI|nr:uncharacterized protein K489DRAFT_381107 [Dissoconium aciculare CBS 342.82]KAF1822364.1 hypothetical protein K489DRAFT_381107 [Dissoconium aciculare CBS 342.82]